MQMSDVFESLAALAKDAIIALRTRKQASAICVVLSVCLCNVRSDYETAYELETDEDALKDIKLKVKKVRVCYI